MPPSPRKQRQHERVRIRPPRPAANLSFSHLVEIVPPGALPTYPPTRIVTTQTHIRHRSGPRHFPFRSPPPIHPIMRHLSPHRRNLDPLPACATTHATTLHICIQSYLHTDRYSLVVKLSHKAAQYLSFFQALRFKKKLKNSRKIGRALHWRYLSACFNISM